MTVEAACAERPEAGLFLLPGGYVAADGAVHRAVELAPVTGQEEDLLNSLPPQLCTASVVTRLLTRCLKRVGAFAPVNQTLVSDLLTGDRDYLLLRLREMTFGPQVAAVWHCANPGCGKPVDIAFSLAGWAVERKAVDTRFFTHRLAADEAVAIEFRLPTGADQEALASLVKVDEAQAVEQLLARCVRRVNESAQPGLAEQPATLRAQIVTELAAAIESRAPQVELELEVNCPECGGAFSSEFDFTAFFLRELQANQRALEREVHFLAWHYHWSEHDILALTRRKRRRYVALLQEELERIS